ncbi:hypothetical protein QQP08_009653 [Theobroma cacao]|uniref:Late embryogenesis abundant protein At1g64065 n=1 Tax=Theobroma cacao TaxID=3641 RepID=A0AB32W3D3_THECC|nr:PREDICTED: late embryogenesis abundant protein At1g64065 [Theobroma cacao]WRX17166.1 hypothetical protein QQP08_009653 [Theobroma cacao]
MAQTNSQARKDEESALVHSRELPDLEQSKDFRETESEEPTLGRSFELNRKNLAILAASVIVIVLIIVFSILIFSTKNPKIRVRSAVVQNLNYSTSSNPSFSMRFVTEMTVKNPNFGYFRYGSTNVTFAYRGVQLVQVLVPGARIRGFGTGKITATMDLNSNNVRNDTNLGSDIRSGFLTLTGQSKMNGKVYLMSSGKRRKVNGRRRYAAMNCTLTVNLAEKSVQDIKCPQSPAAV